LTELNAEAAFTREVVTAGTNAPTMFGRENPSKPRHLITEKGEDADITIYSKKDRSIRNLGT
jgi:hypothetical protein